VSADRRLSAAAVVFDMDGVLVDTTPIHEQTWNDVLAAHQLSLEVPVRDLLGRRGTDVLAELVANPRQADALLAELRHVATQRLRDAPDLLVPGVPKLLDRLRADGKRLGLATSAYREAAEELLGATLLARFDAIVTAEQVPRGKPEPDVYATAATSLGTPPSECVAVEDAIAGVQAARAAGLGAIGVTGTTTSERLRDAGADAVVTRTADVADVVV